jgi:hypothetical protein
MEKAAHAWGPRTLSRGLLTTQVEASTTTCLVSAPPLSGAFRAAQRCSRASTSLLLRALGRELCGKPGGGSLVSTNQGVD